MNLNNEKARGVLAEPSRDPIDLSSQSAGTTATTQPHEPSLDDCAAIARSPDVLGVFADTLAKCGVVGEERLAKLLYLALTTRLLAKPVSVAVKGPSSGGKSYVVQKVLDFFPSSAYYELSAMSEKALVYSKEPLQHRFLVLYEAAGMRGDFAEYLIRSLLSEGRLRYETVEKSTGGSLQPRFIEREGPTGLIVTTTLASMHPENETRYLSVTVEDTPKQTEHILRALAADERSEDVDLEPWQVFQLWLEVGNRKVSVPFASDLVELIPPVAVRLRRDFAKLLALIRGHALLHRTLRHEDAQGRIVADLDDYRHVYDLVVDVVAAGVEATVPQTVRETVETVAQLAEKAPPYEEGVSSAQIAAALGLDKSAAWRRVRVAMQKGYLENLEGRKGKRAQLVLGDPLPEERTILPSPDELTARRSGCTVAGVSGVSSSTGRGEDVAEAA
jgi:hypothetical protein